MDDQICCDLKQIKTIFELDIYLPVCNLQMYYLLSNNIQNVSFNNKKTCSAAIVNFSFVEISVNYQKDFTLFFPNLLFQI